MVLIPIVVDIITWDGNTDHDFNEKELCFLTRFT